MFGMAETLRLELGGIRCDSEVRYIDSNSWGLKLAIMKCSIFVKLEYKYIPGAFNLNVNISNYQLGRTIFLLVTERVSLGTSGTSTSIVVV